MKKRKLPAARRARNYPLETKGGRIAAEARRETNTLSRDEWRKLFAEAMVTIYGDGSAKIADASVHSDTTSSLCPWVPIARVLPTMLSTFWC